MPRSHSGPADIVSHDKGDWTLFNPIYNQAVRPKPCFYTIPLTVHAGSRLRSSRRTNTSHTE
jgi:hypothetical protein